MKIEIAYASAARQTLLTVDVAEDATIEAAIQKSGILARCPEIDLSNQKVGIFSKVKPLTTVVAAGDRIEIYRPVIAKEKEADEANAD